MFRKAKSITCSEDDRTQLEALARSRTSEARLVDRARMVTACLGGELIQDIAGRFHTRPNTVIFWRDRFIGSGVDGLMDLPRSGRPAHYKDDFRNSVLTLLEKPPPAGHAHWDGGSIAEALGVMTPFGDCCVAKEFA